MRRIFLSGTLLLCFLYPALAQGQIRPNLTEGARIRVVLTEWPVTAGAERQIIRGDLTSYSGDSLTVQIHPEADPLTLAWSAVSRLDRSLGIPSRLDSSLRRGAAMGIFGALYFGVRNALDAQYSSTGEAVAIGAGTGAVTGLVLGALFRYERWSRVDVGR